MAGNEKTVKFVRALHLFTGSGVGNPTFSAGQSSMLLLKTLYEFWGFCVNGGDDLRSPGLGSFASLSGSLAPNYLRMVPGFESGSTVLIASGSDGTTSYGTNVFSSTSANFSFSDSSEGRRLLVTWKSGSASTDDGMYPILRILNSQSIVVDTNTGATPMSASNFQPRFTDRGSINYRVIDMWEVAKLTGYVQDDYMIMQFNAGAINPGQAASQARLRLFSGSSSGPIAASISMSPSGSWNGSSFSDKSLDLDPDSGNLNGSGVGGPPRWVDVTTRLYVSFFADQGSIIMHAMSGDNPTLFSSPCNFHIEIPNRMFPKEKDPNPICCLSCAADNGHQSIGTKNFSDNRYHGSGWFLANPLDNAVIRRYHPMVRTINGSALNSSGLYASNWVGFVASTRLIEAFYNVTTRRHIIQDIVLGHRVSGASYTMGRVQLRRIAFATGPWRTMTKLGARGEWISTIEGILWPWDNANLPHTLFPTNSGNSI